MIRACPHASSVLASVRVSLARRVTVSIGVFSLLLSEEKLMGVNWQCRSRGLPSIAGQRARHRRILQRDLQEGEHWL